MTSGPVTCVYHAYEEGELVATGRLILDDLPSVDDEVVLNGRPHVVSGVGFYEALTRLAREVPLPLLDASAVSAESRSAAAGSSRPPTGVAQ